MYQAMQDAGWDSSHDRYSSDDAAETEACMHRDAEFNVYANMHRVRHLITASIDDPYTWDQLTGPRITRLVVRPLVDRLYDESDTSLVYCLLANRVHFLRQPRAAVHISVNLSRASLCEIIAARILRRFSEENPSNLVALANVLVQGLDPFQGAPEDILRFGRQVQWPIQSKGGNERKLTALELAILGESKMFISTAACQRIVNAVYEGHITYSAFSSVDILPDHYKHHPVALYNPRKSRLLNHYRLNVPQHRNIIEIFHFLILVALYMAAMFDRGSPSMSTMEFLFIVYTIGWLIDSFAATIEHGWEVHSQNLWSFLDLTFAAIFCAYVMTRIMGMAVEWVSEALAWHILCIAAPILLTRVAFNLMPDNIVFISLHAMMKDFMLLTVLAIWCFAGFLLGLQWLTTSDRTTDSPKWYTVAKWLLWIWFGLDGTGIEESVKFHVILGPALMVAFAFLGNTLFLTILVAMLTNTFSRIVAAESAEIQFRKAVLTFEGVKSDSIFAYPPPLNILAILILWPLKMFVSPRKFHTIHVAMVRVINAPILLLINLYERSCMWHELNRGSKTSWSKWRFAAYSPHGDIQAVFNAPPPPGIEDEAEELDGMSDMGFLDNDEMSRTSREMPRSVVFRLSNATRMRSTSRGTGRTGRSQMSENEQTGDTLVADDETNGS